MILHTKTRSATISKDILSFGEGWDSSKACTKKFSTKGWTSMGGIAITVSSIEGVI
ncbi:hypothetical protein FQU23_014810 [Flavobacterium sp. XN-5]|uniref:hypothetical protein n=1 Tax=Flavobacterium sp. XN-5 TaxID=2599390 RepID=UPI0013EF3C22|nr:hypothetical protein [Flavobacterium sp. XN-5]NGY38774.1 hypothetical protein [Flavobacterium sp. XN-5]